MKILQIKVAAIKKLQVLQLFAALQLHSGCKDLQCGWVYLNLSANCAILHHTYQVLEYLEDIHPIAMRLTIVIRRHHHANDGCLSFLTFPVFAEVAH